MQGSGSFSQILTEQESEFREKLSWLRVLSQKLFDIKDFVTDGLPPFSKKILSRGLSKLEILARDKGWWGERGTDLRNQKQSHRSLLSGVVAVPLEDMDAFREAHVSDILENELFYLCEIPVKDEFWQLAIDLDIDHPDSSSQWDLISQLVELIHAAVKTFYPRQQEIECVVCLNIPYLKVRGEQTYYHWGAHLYFVNIILVSSTFLMLRKYILLEIAKRYSERPTPNEWKQVVDSGTYMAGLRLLGASKVNPCPLLPTSAKMCKRTCNLCLGRKGIGSWTMYLPFAIFTNGKLDVKRSIPLHTWSLLPLEERRIHWKRVVTKCTLRPSASTVLTPNVNVPSCVSMVTKAIGQVDPQLRELCQKTEESVSGSNSDTNNRVTPQARSKFLDRNEKKNRSTPSAGNEKWPPIHPSSEIFTVLHEFFQGPEIEGWCSQFANIQFTKITRCPKGHILHLETKARYCLNIGKEHKHCRIRFCIGRGTRRRKQVGSKPEWVLTQRCRCDKYCNIKMGQKGQKMYISNPLVLPDKLIPTLFPDFKPHAKSENSQVRIPTHPVIPEKDDSTSGGKKRKLDQISVPRMSKFDRIFYSIRNKYGK